MKISARVSVKVSFGVSVEVSIKVFVGESVGVSVEVSGGVYVGVYVEVSGEVSVRVSVRALDYELVGGVYVRNQPVVGWVGRQGGGAMTEVTWSVHYTTVPGGHNTLYLEGPLHYRCEAVRTRYQS